MRIRPSRSNECSRCWTHNDPPAVPPTPNQPMTLLSWPRPLRWAAAPTVAVGLLTAAGCSHPSSSTAGAAPAPAANMSASAPSPDPRVGLHAGWFNAGEAIWNLQQVSSTPPVREILQPEHAGRSASLELRSRVRGQLRHPGQLQRDADLGHVEPQQADAEDRLRLPRIAERRLRVSQSARSFPAEATNGRIDCGIRGRAGHGQHRARARHSDLRHQPTLIIPKSLTVVQTCRGSHTNTLVTDPNDNDERVHLRLGIGAPCGPPDELPGCVGRTDQDPNTALFRIEVIQVPLAHPEQAHIVSSPRIFHDRVRPAKRHGESSARFRESGSSAAAAPAGRASSRRAGATAARCAGCGTRPDAMPRHYGLSGGRPRGRRVQRLWTAARYPRPCRTRAH